MYFQERFDDLSAEQQVEYRALARECWHPRLKDVRWELNVLDPFVRNEWILLDGLYVEANGHVVELINNHIANGGNGRPSLFQRLKNLSRFFSRYINL